MTINITNFWLHSVLPNKISAFSGIFLLFSKNTSVRSHFSKKNLKTFYFSFSFYDTLFLALSIPLLQRGLPFPLFLRNGRNVLFGDNNIIMMSTVTLRSIVVYLE